MDLEQEISKALADPDIMNKVSSVLSSMGGNSSANNNNEETDSSPLGEVGNLGNIMGALKNAPADDRTRLLMAIKPFLSEKRAPYMDSAVTILRLASIGKLGKDLKLF